MSVLSDRDIIRRIAYRDDSIDISPFSQENVQPASYDLTLGDEFVKYHDGGYSLQSVELGPTERRESLTADSYVVDPGEFVLGHTVETIRLPNDVTAEVKGRSSIGRLGLIPHTAGWIDPGFEGEITLEFVNHSPQPVEITSGMRIAQIVFSETRTPAGVGYGEKDDQKYQGQTGATESKIQEDGE